ncbi:MAG TPA: isoprenylcysteine carboxylmethyltransferase family protein [Chloroflexi bacterium]|nr:isoprenylcysteine carboxylmethyltransferase family protein [Chloroflexota bacterium]
MLTGIYQSIAILITITAFYITDCYLISRFDRERQAKGSGRSWGFTLLALGMASLVVIQPIALPSLGIHTDAWWGICIQGIGLMLVISALGLQVWSRLHLRQFYAERVEIQPEHCVIDTGPYAYVRHPFFTALFMLAFGLLLINPSLSTVIVAVYTFWDFTRAAKQEEILLSENLVGYTDYMARTPRFIPRFGKQLEDRRYGR